MKNINELPIIDLRLSQNEPAKLNETQELVLPYLTHIETTYWIAWWGVLAYLIARFILLPFFRKVTHRSAKRSGPGNLDSRISDRFASQSRRESRMQEQKRDKENETEPLRKF